MEGAAVVLIVRDVHMATLAELPRWANITLSASEADMAAIKLAHRLAAAARPSR